MRKSIQHFFMLSVFVLGFACENDEQEVIKKSGKITFSFTKKEISGGRQDLTGTPTFIVLTVEDGAGQTVIDNKKLQLIGFGDNYVTEDVVLQVGNYKLTSFLVLNEQNNTLFATPIIGSTKAEFVSKPLPIAFNVSDGSPSTLRAEVLTVESTDAPEQFGYTSFAFDVVPGDKVNVRVRVELTVGQIHYQDVDAQVKVTGYNASNEAQWMQEFSYVGPVTNLFAVKKGYHHYDFTITQWGITDRQVVSGQQLEESTQGPLPTTFVLGGSKPAKRLTYYVNSIERPDPIEWGKTYLEPQSRVEYEYHADGKIDKMRIYGYVQATKKFEEQRYFVFQYANGKVSNIVGYHLGQSAPYIEDIYTYANGRISGIKEVNQGAGVTTDLTVSYDDPQQLITASYASSNGTSFTYQFTYQNKKITSDKISRFGALCSTGSYTYDKKINPLAHLGYTDFLFRNFSVNNKIAENVNYTACAFPTLIPEAYVHVYDNDGYPTLETTVYKGSNLTMKTEYFYQ